MGKKIISILLCMGFIIIVAFSESKLLSIEDENLSPDHQTQNLTAYEDLNNLSRGNEFSVMQNTNINKFGFPRIPYSGGYLTLTEEEKISNTETHPDGTVIGTMGFLAICNDTGKMGVVTNKHVTDISSGKIGYGGVMIDQSINRRDWVNIGNVTKSKLGGTIDASFIEMDDQRDWVISPEAAYKGNIYSNVKLGNPSDIRVGTPIFVIGGLSGTRVGKITKINVSETVSGVRLSGLFNHDAGSDNGDSGGPIFYHKDNEFYLIGLNFAGTVGGGKSFGCSVFEIIRELNITPITNDSFSFSNIFNSEVQLNGLNFKPMGVFNLPEKLNNRTITRINKLAFKESLFNEIHIPSTVEKVEDNIFAGRTGIDIYMDNRTSLPSTFAPTWNREKNNVFFNNIVCNHDNTRQENLDENYHGLMCIKCRTSLSMTYHRKYTSNGVEYCHDCSYSKQVGETHVHDYIKYTWINSLQHRAECLCGYTTTRRHVLPPYGGTTCIDCDGHADIGIGIMNN